jgi:Uma2 family endonuclease
MGLAVIPSSPAFFWRIRVDDMSTATKRFTPDDLLSLPDDGHRYELVDGELVEKGMGAESDLIGGIVYHLLALYCASNPVGLPTPETNYQCFPDDPGKVRRPDASFIRKERVPAAIPRGYWRIAPDMAVEVVSPNDLYSEVEAKVNEYLAAGVRLVWVIDPPTLSVRVHRADGTVTDIGPDGELSGEDIVRGFHCPVASLFPSPRPA